jgi:cell division protein FtsL
MQTGEALHHTIPVSDGEPHRLRYSPYILVVFVLMAVTLLLVWTRLHMTQLEYRVADEMNRKERLLEEQRKLRLEYATLKAPQRIEGIAKEKLSMSYPEQGQVIVLKKSEGK